MMNVTPGPKKNYTQSIKHDEWIDTKILNKITFIRLVAKGEKPSFSSRQVLHGIYAWNKSNLHKHLEINVHIMCAFMHTHTHTERGREIALLWTKCVFTKRYAEHI